MKGEGAGTMNQTSHLASSISDPGPGLCQLFCEEIPDPDLRVGVGPESGLVR